MVWSQWFHLLLTDATAPNSTIVYWLKLSSVHDIETTLPHKPMTQNLLGRDPTTAVVPAYTLGYPGSSYHFQASAASGLSSQSSSVFFEVGKLLWTDVRPCGTEDILSNSFNSILSFFTHNSSLHIALIQSTCFISSSQVRTSHIPQNIERSGDDFRPSWRSRLGVVADSRSCVLHVRGEGDISTRNVIQSGGGSLVLYIRLALKLMV